MRKRKVLGLAFGLAAVAAVGLILAAAKIAARPDGSKAGEDETPGKAQRGRAFIEAFNKGDAKAVAGFWTPEGQYVDEDGRTYKGRAAIEKLYRKVFAENKGAKLAITVTSARRVGADVVLEDGFTEVTPADGGPPDVTRFSAVLTRKDGEWYLESVHDAPAQPPTNAEHFEGLAWLIGEWTGASAKGESNRASYDWAENGNFIVSSFAVTLNDVPVVGGTQWIGWDAAEKRIRSWSFYSGGGFGEATWTTGGDKWTLKTTARLANGKKATATNILTRVDDDHATWQMTGLTIDGEMMPDQPPVKLKRVKDDQP
jgi:uncharacterized protein (TIGR02246 family)